MAITAMATEDIEVDGNVIISTTAGFFDSRLVRYAMTEPSTLGTFTLDLGGVKTEGWAHFEAYVDDAVTNDILPLFWDTANNKALASLIVTATTPELSLQLNGTNVGTPFTIVENSLLEFDLYYLMSATVGKLEVYVNGSLKASFSGDTTVAGSSGFDKLAFKSFYDTTVTSSKTWFSQICFDDSTSTIGAKVHSGYPTAEGPNLGWTGAYTDVDDPVLDTTDFISTNTLNDIRTFETANIHADFNTYSVSAVQVSGALRIANTSAVNDLRFYFNDLVGTATSANLGIPKDNSVVTPRLLYLTNPINGSAWDKASFDGMKFGVESV